MQRERFCSFLSNGLMGRFWAGILMMWVFKFCCVHMACAADVSPIDLGEQRELFVDDFLIQSLTQARQVMHTPEPKEVVIVCDSPWEGNTSAYYTLFQDGDLFRMYYRGAHSDLASKKNAHPEFVCYAESRDGVHWEKPKLGLIEFQGSKENNILRTGPGSHNFTPFKDGNPNCSADARYKALAGGTTMVDGKRKACLQAYKSPDGIHWTLMREEAVITDGAFDSQNLAFWHPEKKVYLDFHRKGRGGVRDIMTCSSTDFLNWTQPEFLAYGDAPSEHLYTNAIQLYFRAPQIFLGFPTRFQPKHEQVEPILMTSRDGRNFKRWPEPLIPITAPKDRDGNRSNYMARGLLQLPGQDRELSLYATEAYYAGPGSRVRRFTIRTDGFVSVQAGNAQGELLTRPIKFSGKQLTLNYAARPADKSDSVGQIRVGILNADSGEPIKGFSLDDCEILSGNEIQQTVKWKGHSDLSGLRGRAIRLKFSMQQADLYSIQFAN